MQVLQWRRGCHWPIAVAAAAVVIGMAVQQSQWLNNLSYLYPTHLGLLLLLLFLLLLLLLALGWLLPPPQVYARAAVQPI